MQAGTLKHELESYAAIAAYLYVCFAALVFYKAAVLHDEGIAWMPHGFAAVKALILGKFVLIGEGVGIGRLATGSRLRRVAYKVAAFWLMLLVLSGLEEGAKAAFHGAPFWPAVAKFFLQPTAETVASSLIMVLVLVPYVIAREAAARPERS